MNKTIELDHISASYGEKVVLKNISLTVTDRDFLGIIGPNGGGKTTLIKTILGLKKISAGHIRFYHKGQQSDHITMGYLPQYNSIDKKFPISVYETILSGLGGQKSLFTPFSQKDYDQVDNVIGRMGLRGLEKRSVGELSGGQLQRALLGRAVVSNPDVVILDEPSTYIDKRFEAKLYELLEEINQDCAIILVSHDIGTVLQNVKSIACVNETLHYHPDTEISVDWLEKNFNCPIELLGHGQLPHRVLSDHNGDNHKH